MSPFRPSYVALALLFMAGGGAAAPPEVPESIRWDSAAGQVEFAHRRHVEEYGAECVVCHHETVAATLELPHPDYFDGFWVDCKGCHTGRTERTVESKCSTCHPARVAGLNQEIPTVKVAVHRSCWGCHDRGSGAEASKQCSFCHQPAGGASALSASTVAAE